MPRPLYGDTAKPSPWARKLGHFLTLYPPFYQQFPGIITKYVFP